MQRIIAGSFFPTQTNNKIQSKQFKRCGPTSTKSIQDQLLKDARLTHITPRALRRITVKVKKNAKALQTLHKHYNNSETMETTSRINVIFSLVSKVCREFDEVTGKLFHVRAIAYVPISMRMKVLASEITSFRLDMQLCVDGVVSTIEQTAVDSEHP